MLDHWCLNAFQRTSVPDYFNFLLSVFQLVFAVETDHATDLRDANSRYHVIYQHINHDRSLNVVLPVGTLTSAVGKSGKCKNSPAP